jgi:glycerol-1-phosphate dehydrogenase [NAD(P)+]
MKYVIWMFAIRKWCMMRFDFKALSDSCECGKEHKLDVRDIYLEPGALDRLPGVLSENQWNSPAILADENTWKAAGEKAYSLLEAEQIKCTSVILPPDGLHADEHGVALAEKDIARETDVLLAVGSGTVHDITRYIANKCGLPFISIPTAASVDGFVSTVAAMTWKGCKQTFQAVAPLYVLADTDIFTNAPRRLTASGFGDLLGKYTALADWRIANLLTGEYICERVIHLTEQALEAVVAAPEDCERIMYGLLLSGLAMQMVGNSRPASGGEHHLSHFWEMEVCNGPLDALHGEKVGVGLLLCAEEYRNIGNTLMRGDAVPISVDGLLEKELESGFPDVAMRDELRRENTPDPLASISGEDILRNSERICEIIDRIPTVSDMTELIRAAGGKITMADIGLDPALKDYSLCYSPYVRLRLTLMRLRKLVSKAN